MLRIDPSRVRLRETAREVVRRAQLSTDRHAIELAWEDDAEALADPRRVYQVLQNLISNAVKYSPQGGRITVGAGPRGRDLVVSVADEGLGLPPREIDKIFDRFHRVGGETSRMVGGTGLGLAICRGLVDAHGGRIWAESDGEGRGSTFRFTLPLASPVQSGGAGAAPFPDFAPNTLATDGHELVQEAQRPRR